jgi:hypothetical protein
MIIKRLPLSILMGLVSTHNKTIKNWLGQIKLWLSKSLIHMVRKSIGSKLCCNGLGKPKPICQKEILKWVLSIEYKLFIRTVSRLAGEKQIGNIICDKQVREKTNEQKP